MLPLKRPMSIQTNDVSNDTFDIIHQGERDLRQQNVINIDSHRESYKTSNLSSFETDSNRVLNFFLKSVIEDTAVNTNTQPKSSQPPQRNKKQK